ncbi:MAG: transcription termination factor Rho, partial [Tissierellia bacterium]|nr:transcription termination factor Rho [Tissierellia bacterium]
MDLKLLKDKKLEDLRIIAKEIGVKSISKYKKSELVDAIISQLKTNEEENQKETHKDKGHSNNFKQNNEKNNTDEKAPLKIAGILDLNPDGYGFLRSEGYNSGDDDIYVPPVQVRRFGLKTGDYIEGLAREKRD